jgi:Uma2 family endonuclease
MAMPLSIAPTTADELDAIPEDGNRYEIIDGTLFVSPAPSRSHQRAVTQLVLRLAPYAHALGLDLLPAPTDVRSSNTTQVQPDLLALPMSFDGRSNARWEPMSRVLLTVEILSSSTRWLDRVLKRKLYVSEGVTEYWVVDLDARSISVSTADRPIPRVVTDVLQWQPRQERAPLALDLRELFSEIHLSP